MHFHIYILGLTLNVDNTMFEVQNKFLSLSHSWSFVRHIEFQIAAILSKMIFHKYGHVLYRWIANLMLIRILIGNNGPECTGK